MLNLDNTHFPDLVVEAYHYTSTAYRENHEDLETCIGVREINKLKKYIIDVSIIVLLCAYSKQLTIVLSTQQEDNIECLLRLCLSGY